MIRNKYHHQEGSDRLRIAMDETEKFHIKKIDTDFSKKLIQYRLDRNMTRKDLARILNEKEAVISAIENGSAIHDGKLVHKIRLRLKI